MNLFYKSFLLGCGLALLSLHLIAQSGYPALSEIPENPGHSPIFGNDIIINDEPNENQDRVALCSAYNGWLYSIYTYNKNGSDYLAIVQSTNNGISWTVLYDEIGTGFPNLRIEKIDAVVLGNSVPTLKIFLGLLFHDTIYNTKFAYLSPFNINTLFFEDQLLPLPTSALIKDIAIASDNIFPATNSDPNSLGAVCSLKGVYDSIVFYSSSNGGISLDSKVYMASTSKHFGKVALAYGRSPSYPEGRYFAAWEEKENESSAVGHLYTAHSEPYFNSQFTSPVVVDSLDSTTINLVRNPVISCQSSDADNNNANLTEVILFEKQVPGENRFDIAGVFNLQAASTSNFQQLSFDTIPHNKLQPDINFNPFDSTFMATFYDSTLQKLPLVKNSFNITNTGSWDIVTPGYNDDGNLSSPRPKVKLNYGNHLRAVTWKSDRADKTGQAMFDAQYIYYTGIPGNQQVYGSNYFHVYPNPCSDKVTFEIDLNNSERGNIEISDLTGRAVHKIPDQIFPEGKSKMTIDVLNYSPGCYFYLFKCNDFSISGKLIIK